MNGAARGASITIWDAAAGSPQSDGHVLCWNGHDETAERRSLLRYVEQHGVRLRAAYLAWVHDLGEALIGGRRLVDRLAYDEGFSYWWMTLIAEKSIYKSPISDAIRLLAVEEILLADRPSSVTLVSGNRAVHESIAELCASHGISYRWQRAPASPAESPQARIYRKLPLAVRTLVTLARFAYVRWPLRRGGSTEHQSALLFCSYFLNVDGPKAEAGRFDSGYWGNLPALLDQHAVPTTWLHLYMSQSAVTAPTAIAWLRRFNDRRGSAFHAFVDSQISLRVIVRAAARWIRMAIVAMRLRDLPHAFRLRGSGVSLWPLLRADWCNSMRGPAAIVNHLMFELFDAALRVLPKQHTGVYLCENQGWERAFIHAWRKHGHGRLIGVAHSTVRFWDLRYFADRRTLRSRDRHGRPEEDLMALNGPPAVDAYVEAGYPRDAIVECEALRYQSLDRISRDRMRSVDRPCRILVLGDYVEATTKTTLRMIEAALAHIGSTVLLTLKPHPNRAVAAGEFPGLQLQITTARLDEILGDFDMAVASSSTAAALDVYVAGLPLVVVLSQTDLNFSPLRGRPDVRFAGTADALAAAISSGIEDGPAPDAQPVAHPFFMDPDLPRWRALLPIPGRV